MSRGLRIGFILLMLGLTALFAALGAWQVQRLGEKEALIATVDTILGAPPVPLERATDYAPVTLTGTYLPGGTVLVFTSLADARGPFSGPGYWVMSAIGLDTGGTVFVNRGFVPQARGAEFAAAAPPAGPQTLTGIARAPEASGSFTPATDIANRIDWVRDPGRLARLVGELPQPVIPYTVDLPAGAPGDLPQGGETVVEFPNNHLGYAITWFGFAILTPVLLAFWIARQRRGKAAAP